MACGLLVCAGAQATGAVHSGAYTVQYSAVNSMQIPKSVARDNGIERSGNTAVVMITLQKPTDGDPLHAVPAQVSGHARDLMGNKIPLQFERIEGANSVYSLSTLPIGDDQTLTFNLEVKAVSGNATVPVEFNQTFYTQ